MKSILYTWYFFTTDKNLNVIAKINVLLVSFTGAACTELEV